MADADDENEEFADAVEEPEVEDAVSAADDDDKTATEKELMDEALTASLAEEVERRKAAGNMHFKQGENFEAIEAYDEAIKYAEDNAKSDKAKTAVKAVLISLHSNKAAARLRREEWEEAVLSATAALELMESSSDPALAPSKSKALFRRGTARSKLGQLSSAKEDLMSACKADPKDRNARTELAQVQERLKAQKLSEKANFAQGFAAVTEKAVAREEAREAARKREEAAKKAAEEEALREEWRQECARLRAERKAQLEEARQARLRKFDGSADTDDAGAVEVADSLGPIASLAMSADGVSSSSASAAADGTDQAEVGAETTDRIRELSKELGVPQMCSPPDVTGTAAAANGDGVDTGEAEADGDGDGDGGDDDEPISFEAWKEQREKAAKEAQERREKEEKEAKERAAEERRRARKAEKIELKDEADLKGFQKGYKIRADGSKTSYFDRSHEIDATTKALLDAQKAPKRLSVGGGEGAAGAAAAGGETSRQEGGSGSGTAGSAWNNGTTWEEKDCSAWAKEALEGRLKGLTAAAPAAAGGWVAKSSKVKEVEGAASVVATRGALRHVFEYAFDLEYRLTAAAAAADEPAAGEDADADTAEGDGKAPPKAPAAIKGTLHYTDVSSSAKSGVVVGGVTNAFKGSPDDEAAALAAVEALKGAVVAAVEQLDVEFRATKRI